MTPKAAVTRYVAFLRAINVGGHVVKMDRLRKHFEALGFSGVKTFIASGNVVFDSPSRDVRGLESRIAAHLEGQLGYEVATFVRTASEIMKIAAGAPFPSAETGAPGASLYVGFFAEPLGPSASKTLRTFRSEVHEFRAIRSELYWLCRISVLDSKMSWSRLEKALGGPATFRNANTVRRIAAILKEDQSG